MYIYHRDNSEDPGSSSKNRWQHGSITALVSAGGVPGHGGHHRKLPGMESGIWPGNEWTEEKEAEGGGAGQQGQTDW